MTQSAKLLGLDWGTSSLRAYLLDKAGNVIETRQESWGIMGLPCPANEGGFDLALEKLCGDWLELNPALPILASGMVGSAQGWKEAAYIDCPAKLETLGTQLTVVDADKGRKVHIVPGLIARGAVPDVMRGEETQIVGAETLGRALTQDSPAMIILPGTHSKWAHVDGNCIVDFTTFMTGEVFAALSQHTILGRLMQLNKSEGSPTVDWAAFERGVAIAQEGTTGGLLAAIFSARTFGLTQALSAEQLPDYLSGLLIGYEISGVLSKQPQTLPLFLVGSDALVERYSKALARFDLKATPLKGVTERGLWHIAIAAGLVKEETKL